MLLNQKIKMAAYYVKNKKWFRLHLGLSHHFDYFYLGNIVFIFYIEYNYNISKNKNISLSDCAIIKILKFFEKYNLSY
jgi:hypothetical protein